MTRLAMIRARITYHLERFTDSARALGYRAFYCTRHGHREKFGLRSQCVNCGARLHRRTS